MPVTVAVSTHGRRCTPRSASAVAIRASAPGRSSSLTVNQTVTWHLLRWPRWYPGRTAGRGTLRAMPAPLPKTPTRKMPEIQVFGRDDSSEPRAALRFFKERRLTVVGSKQMAVFDDMELERKVTIYEKWPEQPTDATYGEWQTRTGDIYSPKIPTDEPLRFITSEKKPVLVDSFVKWRISDVRQYYVEDWIALGFFWLLGLCVFYQFFTRYALNDSAAWTEEISVFLIVVIPSMYFAARCATDIRSGRTGTVHVAGAGTILAADSVDYLASGQDPAAVQHYWSLSIEEQFYVGFALLLVLVLVSARRWKASRTGVEPLRAFAYKGEHLEVFKQRRQWFEERVEPMVVLWWIADGHIPSVEDSFCWSIESN